MSIPWIWWFQLVRDFIRLQIHWPDRQWGYDHLNRYSQSSMIRSSISSLDLLTLLHCSWWKCNRINTCWMISPHPPFSNGGAELFLMHYMQTNPAFVFWSWCRSQGDVESLAFPPELCFLWTPQWVFSLMNPTQWNVPSNILCHANPTDTAPLEKKQLF